MQYTFIENYHSVVTVLALVLLILYTVGMPLFYYKILKQNIMPDKKYPLLNAYHLANVQAGAVVDA
jgi:hypothetical protein